MANVKKTKTTLTVCKTLLDELNFIRANELANYGRKLETQEDVLLYLIGYYHGNLKNRPNTSLN